MRPFSKHLFCKVQPKRNLPSFSRNILKINDSFCTRTFSSLIGQPHHSTHSHLLSPNEVTIGMSKLDYERRRDAFVKHLPVGSVAMVPSSPVVFISNDIPHQFRQNSNLYYLSGFMEPQSLLVLEKLTSEKVHFTMFVRPRDASRELWDGARSGVECAKKIFGADEAFPISEMKGKLQNILNRTTGRIFFDSSVNPQFTSPIFNSEKGIQWAERIVKPNDIFAKLRLMKSQSEIELMRKSASIAAESMIETMKQTQPNIPEYILAARMEFECKKRGAQRLSYPPVVASGIRANTLHYISNDLLLREGEMVLMDAGAEYHCYSSDITRTWPVNGSFTVPQLQLYNLVLSVNKTCINLCRPHVTTMNKIHKRAAEMLMNGVRELGIVSGTGIDEENFFPHSIGHHLGMDVHDLIFEVSTDTVLQPGMVVTIEPGLYIPDHKHVLEQYRGIGIRIEDDVLVTSEDPEVLSRGVPKEPKEIETIMKHRGQ